MRLNDAYQDDIDLIEDIARDFVSIKGGVVCERGCGMALHHIRPWPHQS